MSELDDAIREHLELKRRHGARDDEVRQLEDEAFGSADRPDDPYVAADSMAATGGAERPPAMPSDTGVGAPQAAATEAPPAPPARPPSEESPLPPPPPAESVPGRPESGSPVPPPPPPDRSGVVNVETEEHPAPEPPSDEVGPAAPPPPAGQQPVPPAPPQEPVDEGGAPALYDFESDVVEPEPEMAPPPEPEDAFAELGPGEVDEAPPPEDVLLDDEEGLEFDSEIPGPPPGEPGPGAVTADTDEAALIEEEEFVEETEQYPAAEDELAPPAEAPPEEPLPEEPLPPEEPPPEEPLPDDQAGEPEPEGEDLLEETPEFLEESPEDEDLWFEQKPPQDFDFEDD